MSYAFDLPKYYPEAPRNANPRGYSRLVAAEPVVIDLVGELIKRGDREQFTLLTEYREFNIIGITELTTMAEIPGFRTPQFLEVGYELYCVVDLRNCTKVNKEERKLEISKPRIHTFTLLRAKLAILHIIDPTLLDNYNNINGKVFSSLFRSTLERKFQLTRDEAQTVRNLAANYWINLFNPNETPLDERASLARLSRICRISNTTPELYRLSHSGEAIFTLDGLCESIVAAINTPKLRMLNRELLVSMLSITHDEPDFAWHIAVGLVYPPSFIALVQSALLNQTKSFFSTIVKNEMMVYRQGRDAARDLATILKM